jgi:hypothetical protein
MKHRIAAIPDDGIGKEVVPEGRRVLDAAAPTPPRSNACAASRARTRLMRSQGCQRRASMSFTSPSARAPARTGRTAPFSLRANSSKYLLKFRAATLGKMSSGISGLRPRCWQAAH